GAGVAGPFRRGRGTRVGPAGGGRWACGNTPYSPAVGNTAHAAARLEQATKDFDCELVVSEALLARAGVDPTPYPSQEIALRNRARPVAVRIIKQVATLSPS